MADANGGEVVSVSGMVPDGLTIRTADGLSTVVVTADADGTEVVIGLVRLCVGRTSVALHIDGRRVWNGGC